MTAVARLLLAALGAIAPGGAEAAEDFVNALRGLDPELRGKALEERAAEVAHLPGSVPAWLDVRALDALPPAGDGEGEPLSKAQSEFLDRVGPKLARDEILIHVSERLATGPAPAWRGAALELLRWHASASDVELLVELVREPDGKLSAESALLPGFQETFVEIVRRDARIHDRLGWISGNAPALLPAVVRSLGLAGDVEALPYLAGMLEKREISRVALQEISRLAPKAPRTARAGLAERVRPYLEAADKATLGHAIRALVALRDEKAVPPLVALAEAQATPAREAVFAALRDLTGQSLPDQAVRWRKWHEGEVQWLEKGAPEALHALSSAEEARVVSAIREIAGHGLERDRLAEGIVGVLRTHPSAAVRAQACIALGRLRSDTGIEELAQALSDPDPAVGGHALRALQAITGLDLPWDPNAWRQALRSRG